MLKPDELEELKALFKNDASRGAEEASKESLRIATLLKRCRSKTKPSEERILARLQEQPQWEDKLRGVKNCQGLLKVLLEEKQRVFSKPSLRTKKEKPTRRPEPERFSKKRGLTNLMDYNPPPPKKHRFTVHLPEDLINEIKNAVFWTPGLTISALAENALRSAVEDLEDELGDVFPQRTQELKGGRPIE